jgi:hypothetical protein
MHLIISALIFGAFVGLLAFSVAACFHVEESKRQEFREGLFRWGPFVPEALLTPKGKKFALARNLCAIGFAGGGVLYGIVLQLMS